MTPFPLIEISGTPLERGHAYGRQAATRIRASIAHYKEQVRKLSLSDAGIAAVVRKYLPMAESYGQHYVQEMRGIAEGADVAFDDVFLLNARTEIMKIAQRPDLQKKLAADVPDGCTSVTVLPAATRDGQLIHAQNWDWKEECVDTGVVLRVLRDDGPDFLTFTEAGMLARSGLNAAGIAITGNNLECNRDYSQIGVPLPFIRRRALESAHLAIAMHAVYATPKSGSNNMAVSHRDGIVLNFECAPDETFTIEADERGLLVHSNHWLSPVALGKLKDTGVALSPCTLYRHTRVRELLLPHVGRITADDVKHALLDDYQSPWSVCRPPRQDFGRPTRSATVATIVMQPALGVIEVAALPAVQPAFTRYTLAAGSQVVDRKAA